MENNTLTMALMGDVPLREFASAMANFYALIDNLSGEIDKDNKIEWVIEALESGSAIATIRPLSGSTDVIRKVIAAYATVGDALKTNAPIPYSEKVSGPAKSLTQLLNGKITSLRFETYGRDITISGHYDQESKEDVTPYKAFGVVKGRLQTLSSRRGVRFTLYDSVFDKAISCYLREGQDDSMLRENWGKKVLVTGLISRDHKTGKPYSIRDISAIEPVKSSPPGSWRKAMGILKLNEGETSESAIRAARDD